MTQGSCSIGRWLGGAASRKVRPAMAITAFLVAWSGPLAPGNSWRLSDCLTIAAAAQDVDEAVTEAYGAGDLQTDLPPELRRQLDRTYEPQDLQQNLPAEKKDEPIVLPKPWDPPDWLAWILNVMFWLLIGVLALLAIFYLGREIPVWLGRRRRLKPGEAAMVQGTNVAVDGQLLDALSRADRLAAEGQFAEALHLLLLHSIDYLKRHLGGVHGPSNTAREILHRSRLPDTGRRSLGAIVDAAEVSYFGGRPVDGGTYATCRRHYQTFAFGGVPS
jgi:Domain of unknown function (DUF4129)